MTGFRVEVVHTRIGSDPDEYIRRRDGFNQTGECKEKMGRGFDQTVSCGYFKRKCIFT